MLGLEQDVYRRPFLTGRLAEDPDLLREVKAARSSHVSLKRFRGWEPITYYKHQGGRLISSQPEVEWDDEQQGWMLALQIYEENRCPGCGGNLTVTTAPEHEDAYRHELPLQCHRCVAFARAHEAYKDEPHPQTLIHLVQQKPASRPKR